GTVAAAVRTRNTNSATARAIGGSHSHAPTHDTARNSPTAVAMAASGGHSRSQNVIHRACFRARTSMAPATYGAGTSVELSTSDTATLQTTVRQPVRAEFPSPHYAQHAAVYLPA